jgi:type III secretory pathway component EscU
MKFVLLANLRQVSRTFQSNALIFNGEEHAAHVTINCCGALCLIVVLCNVTELQENVCFRAYFVAAIIDHLLCMRK